VIASEREDTDEAIHFVQSEAVHGSELKSSTLAPHLRSLIMVVEVVALVKRRLACGGSCAGSRQSDWTCIEKDTAGEWIGAYKAGSAFRLRGLRPGGFHVAPPDGEW
jgi:hypothetical protein